MVKERMKQTNSIYYGERKNEIAKNLFTMVKDRMKQPKSIVYGEKKNEIVKIYLLW